MSEQHSLDPLVQPIGFVIGIPPLPRPTLEELQANNPRIVSIKQDTSPTEGLLARLLPPPRGFLKIFAPDALKESTVRFFWEGSLGYSQALWGVEEAPSVMSLFVQDFCVHFTGLFVVDDRGDYLVPCLRHDDRGQLVLSWKSAESHETSNCRIALKKH